jgi:hypothetical protein
MTDGGAGFQPAALSSMGDKLETCLTLSGSIVTKGNTLA